MKAKDARNDYGLRLHDLRHEGTSRFFEVFGLPKMLVQSITGHSSEAMTDRYAHLEARPMILRQFREIYAKLNPGHAISSDTGKPECAPAKAPPIPAEGAAVDTAVRVINPRWKAMKKDAEALRKAVWTQPIRDLADALGISDVAIHKACAKLEVPKPPRGHWLADATQPKPEAS